MVRAAETAARTNASGAFVIPPVAERAPRPAGERPPTIGTINRRSALVAVLTGRCAPRRLRATPFRVKSAGRGFLGVTKHGYAWRAWSASRRTTTTSNALGIGPPTRALTQPHFAPSARASSALAFARLTNTSTGVSNNTNLASGKSSASASNFVFRRARWRSRSRRRARRRRWRLPILLKDQARGHLDGAAPVALGDVARVRARQALRCDLEPLRPPCAPSTRPPPSASRRCAHLVTERAAVARTAPLFVVAGEGLTPPTRRDRTPSSGDPGRELRVRATSTPIASLFARRRRRHDQG